MFLTGKSISSRIVMGEVLKYVPFSCDRSLRKNENEGAQELTKQYYATKERAMQELIKLGERIEQTGNSENTAFVFAHQEILSDPTMDKEIVELIGDEAYCPDSAIIKIYEKYIKIFSKSKNKVIQERASDLRDVQTRLLRCWHHMPEKNLSSLDRPCIVVAEELFPSDTLGLDQKNILGIITQNGGTTSHTAIIARSMEIPALLGVSGIVDAVHDGEFVILDGVRGRALLDPDAETQQEYTAHIAKAERELAITRRYFQKTAETLDGTCMELRVNIASDELHRLDRVPYLDGVGLFRSEFLYLSQDSLPSEEFQFEAYKTVAEAFKGKPVVLRTLDIGGDKQVSYMDLPHEENPFLGNRGLRLCLSREDLFRNQLRAALRASAYGDLRIMFPMVTSLNELRQAKKILLDVEDELTAEKIAWNPQIKVGIMIEVPAIALIADQIVDEVDFVSVGTNDLCQYLCAADRMNADVKAYYQDYHPAMFRLLSELVKVFAPAGKCLSICGELAGDTLVQPLLVGLGVRTLSMDVTSIARAKRVIRHLKLEETQQLATQVLQMKTNDEIVGCLNKFADMLRAREAEL